MTTFANQLEALPASSEAHHIILTIMDTHGRIIAVDGVEYQVGDMGPRFKFRLPDTFYVRSTRQDEEHHRRMQEATVSDAEDDHLTVGNLAHAFRAHPDGEESKPTVSSKFSKARVHIEDEEGRITAPVMAVAIRAADGKMNLRLRLPPRHAIFDMDKFHTGGPVRQRPPVDPLSLHGVTQLSKEERHRIAYGDAGLLDALREAWEIIEDDCPDHDRMTAAKGRANALLQSERNPIQPPPKAPRAVVHGPPLDANGKFDETFMAFVYGEMLGSGIDEHVCRKALISIEFAWRAFKSMKNLDKT